MTEPTSPALGNILVVDDRPDDLRLLVTLLNERGHMVRPALDGAAALAAARSAPPDLILLDIQMPQLDGYATCRELKADPATATIPVIFISARDEVFDKVQAFAAGGVDHISKPFQAEEVVARVETQLRLALMQQHLEVQNTLLQQEVAERQRVEAELQIHQNQLEELVAARTAALSAANARLQREIAERQRAEEALYLTRFTVERVADALYWIDADANFIDINTAACAMLGYTREELLTMGVFDIDIGFNRERWTHRWAALKADGAYSLETTHRARDGRLIPVELVANYITYGDRELNCAIVRDVSERKRAEEARRAREQAEAASQAKSAFLAHMSHELRTPLNSILGYVPILRRNTRDPALLDGIEAIQQSGAHLLAMINDVLDLARIESGKIELRPAATHLPSLLGSVIGMLRQRAEAKDLRLSCDLPPEIPAVVRVDEKHLRQVLLNLLTNAVKFTDRGAVTLSVAAVAAPDAGIAAGRIRLRFTVNDTGIGIGPDAIVRIFEPFEQAGPPQRHSEGTGLGLAICRNLVMLMGGHLVAQSRPGAGSSFWFELDLPQEVPGIPTAARKSWEIVGYQGPRRKALVVDDRPDNRQVLWELLAPLGFIVEMADDGHRAVTVALDWQPDVILMDILLPGQSGLAATRELRARGVRTPIIAVSASVLDHEAQQSLLAGCDAFLPKPLDPDALLALLADQLGLVWVYVEPMRRPDDDEAARRATGELILPPRADLEALYFLAQRGNLVAIDAQVRQLAARNPGYSPFAVRISELSRTYEDKQVRMLLKAYLEAAP